MTVQRDMQDRLDDLRRVKAQVRIGTIDAVNPLEVALGGATTTYSEDVRSLTLANNGATVAALVWGNDLLVLGEIGDGTVHYVGSGDGVAPAFAGAWVNFDNSATTPGGGTNRDAGFYKAGGRVYLTGRIKTGTSGTTAFTLPSGYRPKNEVALAVSASGDLALVAVTAAGAVVPLNQGSSAVATAVYLDGVDFIAA